MFYKSDNKSRGMILVDILIALSLGVFFISLISDSSFMARDIYERSRERSDLLDRYERDYSGDYMLSPYESYTDDIFITQVSWFGNDMIEIDRTLSSDTNRGGGDFQPSSTSPFRFRPQILSFTEVRARPLEDVDEVRGSSLCSVDFTRRGPIGSFMSDHRENIVSIDLHIEPIILPIASNLPLTDIIIRKDLAYISIDSTTSLDPDLMVVDIRDREYPTILSSINTGPGIVAITMAGDHIFAGAGSGVAQLHVVRVNPAKELVLEKKYQLPLPHATTTPPFASSIFYDQHKIYLGTEKWDGEEFSIIDISIPDQPIMMGGLEIGSKVLDILIRGDTAYIASADDMQLRVIDIRDSANPILVGYFSPSGWERQEGKRINYFEDSLSLSRTSGGFNIARDQEIFSWSPTSSSSVSYLGDLSHMSPTSVDVAGGVYGLIADRSHIYGATRRSGEEFKIFHRELNHAETRFHPLPATPQEMVCDGDNMYILSGNTPVIYEISFGS